MKGELGKVFLAVEFCPPLAAEELSRWLQDAQYCLARQLISLDAELSLAYPLPPPGSMGSAGGRRSEVLTVAGDLREQGVRVGLWPVLDAREWQPLVGNDYYFANSATARIFEQAVEEYLETVRRPLPSHLLIDLEPPQFTLIKPSQFLFLWWRGQFDSARRSLERMATLLRNAGVMSVAAFFPPLILDQALPLGALLQRLAAVPIFGLGWDYYAPLYYSTFAERYLKLSRPLARRLAIRSVKRGVARWRQRVVPFLGTLGPGLMGEPDHLDRPEELGEEIKAAARSGASRIGIYNLEGILYCYHRGQASGKRSPREVEAFFELLRENFAKG